MTDTTTRRTMSPSNVMSRLSTMVTTALCACAALVFWGRINPASFEGLPLDLHHYRTMAEAAPGKTWHPIPDLAGNGRDYNYLDSAYYAKAEINIMVGWYSKDHIIVRYGGPSAPEKDTGPSPRSDKPDPEQEPEPAG